MSPSRSHLYGFDVLRAVGIAAVVWIHGCDTNALARSWSVYATFAVPCFVLMSFFLMQASLCRNASASIQDVMVRRIRRLVPAYLAWSAVYVLVRVAKHALHPASHVSWDWVSVLLFGGASYQLYFIALLIYWTLLGIPLLWWTARPAADKRVGAVVMALLAALLFWVGPLVRDSFAIPPEYSMIRHAAGLTGFVPLGAAAALLWNGERPPMSFAKQRLVMTSLIAVVTALIIVAPGWRIGISVAMFLAALLGDFSNIPRGVATVSRLSYGIFMAHGLFVEGLQTGADLVGIPTGSLSVTIAVIILSFIGSGLLCAALARITKLNWLVT